MVVVGIDGSTKRSGICIMSDGELQYYTLIDLHLEKDTMKRIRLMLLKICEVLDQYDIDEVHMEKAFKNSNTSTTMMLANIAGGIMLYCAKKDIKFIHPEPSVWRAKIKLGQGRGVKRETLKAEAIAAVKLAYGLDVDDDTAEAILIARSAFDLPKLDVDEDTIWEIL